MGFRFEIVATHSYTYDELTTNAFGTRESLMNCWFLPIRRKILSEKWHAIRTWHHSKALFNLEFYKRLDLPLSLPLSSGATSETLSRKSCTITKPCNSVNFRNKPSYPLVQLPSLCPSWLSVLFLGKLGYSAPGFRRSSIDIPAIFFELSSFFGLSGGHSPWPEMRLGLD